MEATLTIDFVPYTFTKDGKYWTCDNFTAFDLNIPEQYQNRKDTPTGVEVNETILDLEQDGKTLTVRVYDCETDEQEIDAITDAFSHYYDGFKEIGWEAMNHYE